MLKQIVFLFLFSSSPAVAQVQDYFPLVSGSTWLYRSSFEGATLTLRISQIVERNGHAYHQLEGYAPTPVLIRQYPGHGLVSWDDSSRSEVPFLRFDGEAFASALPDCKQTGRAELRDSEYKGPVGVSGTVRVIRYDPGQCADTGLTSESFVPNLGLVQRKSTTFLGEETFDLVYAQIGGFTYIQEPGVSFAMALVPLPGQVGARLVLHNRTDEEVLLQFASSQIFDFSVRNSQGEVVYRWSADKVFLPASKELTVRGEIAWQVLLPLQHARPGTYIVEGFLVNRNGRRFAATATVTLPELPADKR